MSGPRVLIVTATIGEGHDLPARVLAQGIREERPEAEVEIVDGVAAMGRVLKVVLEDNSRWVFRPWMNWAFDFQYRLLQWRATRWLAGTLVYLLGSGGLLRMIEQHDPDIVVSTYPGTTEVLGELRRRGRLKVPTCSAITDLAGLRYWAHPGIDLHLITHPESVEEVRAVAGSATRVEAARGLTVQGVLEPRDRGEARRALGLPEDRKVVMVSGGGWGVGDLGGAADVALGLDGVFVVALCGHNEITKRHMDRRYGADPRVRVVGFTHQMSDFLAASDALVHSTAGLTVLEAIIRGCPVISYGWGVAHIRANNEAYRRYGLAEVALKRDQLETALRNALVERPPEDHSFASLPSAASLVLDAAR
ncbi:MAG: MGDG synthase family glycosyltransferase [Gaiellaceae bacterium]